MTVAAIERAFVLGAGLGTRLKSLTAHRPKPLIPVCQKPLITFAFDHLAENGVREFVVNTHHRAEAYGEIFPNQFYRHRAIQFRHEPAILDTAGGIKNVEDLVRDAPFAVYNGDILTDLPLKEAFHHHLAEQNEVTLILRSHGGPLQVAFDPADGRITDIGNRIGTDPAIAFLFTGTYVVSPAFLRRIPQTQKISVVPIFLEMIREGARLGGIVLDAGHWWDLGTREQYLAVHRFLAEKSGTLSFQPEDLAGGTWPRWIHPEARVDATAKVEGATVIGARATVGSGAILRDTIVWDGAEIARDSVLDRCIVTGSRSVAGTHAGVDF